MGKGPSKSSLVSNNTLILQLDSHTGGRGFESRRSDHPVEGTPFFFWKREPEKPLASIGFARFRSVLPGAKGFTPFSKKRSPASRLLV
jgi:hypothetical protein